MQLSTSISQEQVIAVQTLLEQCDDKIEGETNHYFAPGVYARVLKVPGQNYAVGKAHRTQHLTALIKGTATVTINGVQGTVDAPFIWVAEPGKKFVFCHTDCEFLNIHPTNSTDLDEIEAEVIIPEDEYRLELNKPLSLSEGA